MELNPQCIKDILLILEQRLEPDRFGRTPILFPEKLLGQPPLDNYPDNVLMYHIQKMFECNLLIPKKTYINSGIDMITDISPSGHQLLKQLKDETSFKKFVDCLSKGEPILSALLALKP